jgi:RNA polymerase sigma-70 factor (ECF subfamily)
MSADAAVPTDAAGSDADAISAARSSPAAFLPVFDRHYRRIHRYASRRLGRSLADDIASETFTRALAGIGRYDLSQPDAGPWLFGIATHLIAAHRRAEVRAYRALASTGVDPVVDDGDAVVLRLAAQAQGPALGAALAALKPRDRDVLLLFALAELSYDQIAAALDIPVGTVRSRLNRARAQVRPLLLPERFPIDEENDHE